MSQSKLNEHDLELLSASLDNELSDFERRRLNDKVLTDQCAMEKLNRYTLVGAIMKRECPQKINTSFSQQIIEAIELDTQAAQPLHQPANSFIKQITGLALAVSVAVVSFTSFQHFTGSDTDTDQYTADLDASVTLDNQLPMADDYKNKISPRVQFAPAQLNSSGDDIQAQEREIEVYIYNHSGYGSERIILPYAEITELREVHE